MAKLITLRQVFPALVELDVFSCTTRLKAGSRLLSRTAPVLDNKDYKINPVFKNRNPCTLEFQGFAAKRKGWKYQSPRRDYYYILKVDVYGSKIVGWIEHWTGKRILETSTDELSILKHLYSMRDVSAAEACGTVLARRCLEAGITQVFYDDLTEHKASEKMQAFMTAVKEGKLELKEPEEIKVVTSPGIDYEGPNRYAEKKEYKDDYQPV